MTSEIRNFIHPELKAEVVAIGGSYVLTHEKKMNFKGREILYYTGYAVFDTTCCGSGGCTYALVPGYIVEWKAGINEDGRPVTRVEPINDKEDAKEIQIRIMQAEKVQQVKFQ